MGAVQGVRQTSNWAVTVQCDKARIFVILCARIFVPWESNKRGSELTIGRLRDFFKETMSM